ncbi:hypothetical protein DV515_00005463 [Chloebia gouldiae]|uniref:Uncharacterized protein n=1 Tax=Chloebia gouldiae TaxID=44316 RepID=A0A3L8SPF1_CHLGU|nr:hypothetical protein DV515_00005463 [Chloebia gouldiae]
MITVSIKASFQVENPHQYLLIIGRTNSLEDKGRIVSSLKERQSSKSLLACENSEKESRFRRTETDFSNLYARVKQ